MGDLLFTLVNVARRLNVDPELALRATTARFVGRVEHAVELAAAAGEDWRSLDLDAQDTWYEQAKAILARRRGWLRTSHPAHGLTVFSVDPR